MTTPDSEREAFDRLLRVYGNPLETDTVDDRVKAYVAVMGVFDAAIARIVTLEAELRDARRDGERLHWLIDNCDYFVLGSDQLPENSRAAIDAARAAEGKS